MRIDLDQYTGTCSSCGKDHRLDTRHILIQEGAISRLRDVVQSLGLAPGGCIICDGNTAVYADMVRGELKGLLSTKKPVAMLQGEDIHADEVQVAYLEKELPTDTGWLVAVGAGTVHDVTRYVANSRDIPFVAFPTAASVDGFISSVCAMTWHGFKKTMPGRFPAALVADTHIFRKAPYRLTAAGIGDVLGKYISTVDWEIAGLVCGEEICHRICAITKEALHAVASGLEDIHAGGVEGCERLMYAQILSGVGMQFWGNSRPASGAEHHLSHLWEMEVLNPHIDALHGEKVGVGMLLCLDAYHKLAEQEDIAPLLGGYKGMPLAYLKEKFGGLYDSIREENGEDLLLEVDPGRFAAVYPQVRDLIGKLPHSQPVRRDMDAAGCKTTVEQLGLDPAIVEESLVLSPFVRRRNTLMRLRGLLGK